MRGEKTCRASLAAVPEKGEVSSPRKGKADRKGHGGRTKKTPVHGGRGKILRPLWTQIDKGGRLPHAGTWREKAPLCRNFSFGTFQNSFFNIGRIQERDRETGRVRRRATKGIDFGTGVLNPRPAERKSPSIKETVPKGERSVLQETERRSLHWIKKITTGGGFTRQDCSHNRRGEKNWRRANKRKKTFYEPRKDSSALQDSGRETCLDARRTFARRLPGGSVRRGNADALSISEACAKRKPDIDRGDAGRPAGGNDFVSVIGGAIENVAGQGRKLACKTPPTDRGRCLGAWVPAVGGPCNKPGRARKKKKSGGGS